VYARGQVDQLSTQVENLAFLMLSGVGMRFLLLTSRALSRKTRVSWRNAGEFPTPLYDAALFPPD